jgi:hypothetical protein
MLRDVAPGNRIRAALQLVWREISSWGSGIDFSFYDHLQDRIEQLEQELAREKLAPSDAPNHLPADPSMRGSAQCC